MALVPLLCLGALVGRLCSQTLGSLEALGSVQDSVLASLQGLTIWMGKYRNCCQCSYCSELY